MVDLHVFFSFHLDLHVLDFISTCNKLGLRSTSCACNHLSSFPPSKSKITKIERKARNAQRRNACCRRAQHRPSIYYYVVSIHPSIHPPSIQAHYSTRRACTGAPEKVGAWLNIHLSATYLQLDESLLLKNLIPF